MHVMTQETTDMQTAHEKRLGVVYGSDHQVMTKQHAPSSPILLLKRSSSDNFGHYDGNRPAALLLLFRSD
jgi:hypothetical protein